MVGSRRNPKKSSPLTGLYNLFLPTMKPPLLPPRIIDQYLPKTRIHRGVPLRKIIIIIITVASSHPAKIRTLEFLDARQNQWFRLRAVDSKAIPIVPVRENDQSMRLPLYPACPPQEDKAPASLGWHPSFPVARWSRVATTIIIIRIQDPHRKRRLLRNRKSHWSPALHLAATLLVVT